MMLRVVITKIALLVTRPASGKTSISSLVSIVISSNRIRKFWEFTKSHRDFQKLYSERVLERGVAKLMITLRLWLVRKLQAVSGHSVVRCTKNSPKFWYLHLRENKDSMWKYKLRYEYEKNRIDFNRSLSTYNYFVINNEYNMNGGFILQYA